MKNSQRTIPSIPVSPVDTTGAGDAFIGCLLHQISQLSSHTQILENDELLVDMVATANRAGAITTTGYGAIDSLPDATQLKNFQ
jgi:fructokinase